MSTSFAMLTNWRRPAITLFTIPRAGPKTRKTPM